MTNQINLLSFFYEREFQSSLKVLSQYIAFSALMYKGDALDMSELKVTYFG